MGIILEFPKAETRFNPLRRMIFISAWRSRFRLGRGSLQPAGGTANDFHVRIGRAGGGWLGLGSHFWPQDRGGVRAALILLQILLHLSAGIEPKCVSSHGAAD